MTEFLLMGSSVLFAFLAWFAAYRLYHSGFSLANRIRKNLKWAHQLSLNKWYIDDLYNFLIIKPGRIFSEKILWNLLDQNIIDRAINTTGTLARLVGSTVRPFQNGLTQSYALIFTFGTFLILLYLI